MPTRNARRTQDKIEPIVSEEALNHLTMETGILDFDSIAPDILRAYKMIKDIPPEESLPDEVSKSFASIIKSTEPRQWKQFFRSVLTACKDSSKRSEARYLLWQTFVKIYPYTRDGVQSFNSYCDRVLSSAEEIYGEEKQDEADQVFVAIVGTTDRARAIEALKDLLESAQPVISLEQTVRAKKGVMTA